MRLLAIVVTATLSSATAVGQDWAIQPIAIPTRWSAEVAPSNALPEYPRPQLVRRDWTNLNGLWQYAITSKDASPPDEYGGTILVPYPIESGLSGVRRELKPDECLWYRRSLTLPARRPSTRTLLHFGAVDYEAAVYVNGRQVGSHAGGYEAWRRPGAFRERVCRGGLKGA